MQVHFHEHEAAEWAYSKKTPLPPPVKGVSISASYEFPPYSKQVEWCDGETDYGGGRIKQLNLTQTTLEMTLEGSHTFFVDFETDDLTYGNIREFLMDGRD